MDYMLTVGEGENQLNYYFEKAFLYDEKCYFQVLNLLTFDTLFGEYLGEYDNDMELTRKKIYNEFLDHKPNVTFVDGYVLDCLYEKLDEESI